MREESLVVRTAGVSAAVCAGRSESADLPLLSATDDFATPGAVGAAVPEAAGAAVGAIDRAAAVAEEGVGAGVADVCAGAMAPAFRARSS